MLFISLLLSLNLWSALPSLKTKQTLSSIRFISYDGKVTYYQKSNGSLIYATNYSVQEVLSLKAGTHFLVNSTGMKKRIVIEADETYFNDMNLYKKNKIYVSNFATKNAVQIGEGVNAQLQNMEEWVSFYSMSDKTIHVVHAQTPSKNYQIKLSNSVNPYFIPHVQMMNDDLIVYTDINEKGEMAIQSYSTIDQQFKTIFKSPQSATHLEICYNSEDIFIGNFGYLQTGRGSQIQKISVNNFFTKPQFETIYTSPFPDIGNMICAQNKVFFIKTVKEIKELNYLTFEAAAIDAKTKELNIVTAIEHASQIINMDGRLLIPLRGEYFVLFGDSNTTTHDELELKKNKKKNKEEE